MINISICLTDLPKDKITVSEKNGKKYINIVCDKRKEPSACGETHTIYVQPIVTGKQIGRAHV